MGGRVGLAGAGVPRAVAGQTRRRPPEPVPGRCRRRIDRLAGTGPVALSRRPPGGTDRSGGAQPRRRTPPPASRSRLCGTACSWALATSARSRALLLAARQNPDAAAVAIEQALAHHQRLAMPFELGRTLLMQGQLRRREGRNEPPANRSSEALQIFEQLSAPRWVGRASGGTGAHRPAPRRTPGPDIYRRASGRTRRRRSHQPRNRPGPVPERAHRRGQPPPHLPQARHPLPHRTRRQKPGP